MLPRVDLIKTDEFDYLLFNSNDLITNFIKNHGFWGRTESNICQILTDGMDKSIVIDAGANLGGFTLPVAQHLQKQDGKVYCFEPQRIIFQQLCANIFINRLENVYAHNLVLGETSKSLMIPELDFEKAENIGGFSVEKSFRDFKKQFYSNPENKGIDPCVVEGITLDSLRLLKNVSFIKVDIEGAELEFFKGARETIIQNGFPPIFFEVWDFDWYAKKAEETKDYLRNMGYELEDVLGNVIAQHPSYNRYLEVNKKEDKIELRLIIKK